MKIYNIKQGTFLDIPNISLAIGNFDGIHLGHQKIIKELINNSIANKARPAILSFKPHPRQFFSGNYKHFNIITENSKFSFLEQLRIEYYFSLKFVILGKFQMNLGWKMKFFFCRIINKSV